MNKKHFLISILVIVLMVLAGIGTNKSVNKNADLTDLALSNVEALATGENSNKFDCIQPYDRVCGTDWNAGIRYFGYERYLYA